MANVAPYDGAVSYIRFETDKRQSWVLHATRADGKPLPFGTEVLDEHGESVGYVGQASVLYIRAERPPRALNVHLRGGKCEISSRPGAEQPLIGLPLITDYQNVTIIYVPAPHQR